MMKIQWTKMIVTLLLPAALFITVSGCSGQTAASETSKAPGSTVSPGSAEPTTGVQKVINVGITNDPSTVNPLAANNACAKEISKILFLPLAQMNDKLEYTYRLAESITTEDNQTFTIKLNPNVKWTDGENVTADDVIFTLYALTNPAVGAVSISSYNLIEGTSNAGTIADGASELSGVKKIDDHTFTIKTKYPVTLDIFHGSISTNLGTLPKHILENVSPEILLKSELLQAPSVTNGPFKFKEYIAGQYLSFVANEAYYLGAPKLSALNFKILSGTNITVQLENGEIDMNFPSLGNIPNDDYERVRGFENVRTIEGIPSNIQVLFMNSAVIDNVKVRQAIDLAIDRESILTNVLKGEGHIYHTPVTNQIKYWNEEVAAATYDPEKAKQLLAESGWDTSREIVFSVPTGNATREKVSAIITEQLKAIGLNIAVQKADLATTLGKVQKCDYEISIIGMPDIPLDIVKYLRVYASTKYTWTNYSNPRADELVDLIETSIDEETLKTSYYKLQALIAEELPVTGIYSELGLKAVNNRVVNIEPKEYGFLLDLEKWDVQ